MSVTEPMRYRTYLIWFGLLSDSESNRYGLRYSNLSDTEPMRYQAVSPTPWNTTLNGWQNKRIKNVVLHPILIFLIQFLHRLESSTNGGILKICIVQEGVLQVYSAIGNATWCHRQSMQHYRGYCDALIYSKSSQIANPCPCPCFCPCPWPCPFSCPFLCLSI